MEHPTAHVPDDATPRPTNVFEIKARNAKAAKLAELLLTQGASAADAAALPVKARYMAAAIAGVRRPSPVTWDLVVQLVACVERDRSSRLEAEDIESLISG